MLYVHTVLYGEPDEQEIQKALETFTAYKSQLTTISAVRQLRPHVSAEAMRRFYNFSGLSHPLQSPE